MEHLPKKTCQNGISYTLVGDYYIPDLQLPEESRPIGIWGRMHKAYLELYHPAQYNDLVLSGNLWTYLADLNEQAKNRLDCIIAQMKSAGGNYRGVEIPRSDGMGRSYEQHPKPCGGNCPSRTDL